MNERDHGVYGAPRPLAWLFNRTSPPATETPVDWPWPGFRYWMRSRLRLMLNGLVSIPLTVMDLPNPACKGPVVTEFSLH
jgi:hypothetical protein